MSDQETSPAQDEGKPDPDSAKPDHLDAAIDELCTGVRKKAADAIDYYRAVKKWKKHGARAIRLLAILLGSAAGLIPILGATGFIETIPPVAQVPPESAASTSDQGLFSGVQTGQLGYLFAALAAALVTMDKLFGLSSSWTRYITAELNIQRALDRFEIDWVMASAGLLGDDTGKSEPAERLQLLKGFSMEISQIIENETQLWVSEFQSALATLEKVARERQEAARPGSVQLTIQRGAGDQDLVTILVDGRVHQTTTGTSVAIHGVRPGDHNVQVVGKNGAGQEVTASQMVTVPSGGTAPVTLKLT
jgi:hypothetical protein